MNNPETRYGSRSETREQLSNQWSTLTDGENFAKDQSDLSLLETGFFRLINRDQTDRNKTRRKPFKILFAGRDAGGIRKVLPVIEQLSEEKAVEIYGLFDNFAREEFFNYFNNGKFGIVNYTDAKQKEGEDFKPDLVCVYRSATGGEKQRQSLALATIATFQDSNIFLFEDAYNTAIETILELKKRNIKMPRFVGIQTEEEIENIKRALNNKKEIPEYRYFVEKQCLIGDIPPVETLPLVIRGLVPGASSTSEVKDIIQNWLDNPEKLREQQRKAEDARQNLEDSSFIEVFKNIIEEIKKTSKDNKSEEKLIIIGETGKEKLKNIDMSNAKEEAKEKLVNLYKDDYSFQKDSKLISYVSTDAANYTNQQTPETIEKIDTIIEKEKYSEEDILDLVSLSKKFEKLFYFAKDLSKLKSNEKIFFALRKHPRDNNVPYRLYKALFEEAFKNSNIVMLPDTSEDGLNTSEVVRASTVSITTWSGMLGEMTVTGPAIAWIDATVE